MTESPFLIKRYVWLIDLMRRHPEGLTLRQVCDAWAGSQLNHRPGEPLSQRTFIRHREAIADLFGMVIKCRKSDNTYILCDDDGSDQTGDSSMMAWLVNTLAIEGHVRHNPTLRARIMLDAVPAGEQWLGLIVDAMERGRNIVMDYGPFNSDISGKIEVAPYCLKMYGRRWYMLACGVIDGVLCTYGLDRIKTMAITDKPFKYPSDFDPEKFFADYMGVIIDTRYQVETVRISIDEDFAPHLRNVPLHHTQREGKVTYEDGSEDVTFEWSLRPTPDFLMELYRYGSSLEVIKPQWIRDTIAAWAAHHNALYNSRHIVS